MDSKIKKKKIIKGSVYVVWAILVFLLIGLFLSFITMMICRISNNTDENPGDVTQKYKYYQIDPLTNESSYGIVSIFQDIDEYVTYEDNEGNLVLVSQFNLEEYKCTGICYCESNDHRRVASAVVSRGLMYLVAATSAVVAMDKAKEYFDSKCKEEMKDICSPSDHIVTSITDVDGVIDIDFKVVEPEVKEEDGENIAREKGNIEDYKYWCEGNCLTRDRFDGVVDEDSRKQYQETFRCEEVEGAGEVIVQGLSGQSHFSQMILGELNFQNHYLKDLCMGAGKEIVHQKLRSEQKNPYVDKDKNREAWDRVRRLPLAEWTPCVSYVHGKDNPTIKCRAHE